MWYLFRKKHPIEKIINYKFKNFELLERACTHHSLNSNTKKRVADNEVVEFLGDSVLGLCVATILTSRYQKSDEGYLTKRKILITNNKFLAKTVIDLDLAKYLKKLNKISPSENMLADFFEAILGAIYLDRGFNSALKTVEWFHDNVWSNMDTSNKDYKSKLQTHCQKNFKNMPKYHCVRVNSKFKGTVTFFRGKKFTFNGYGATKKEAMQMAAKSALKHLKVRIY